MKSTCFFRLLISIVVISVIWSKSQGKSEPPVKCPTFRCPISLELEPPDKPTDINAFSSGSQNFKASLMSSLLEMALFFSKGTALASAFGNWYIDIKIFIKTSNTCRMSFNTERS